MPCVSSTPAPGTAATTTTTSAGGEGPTSPRARARSRSPVRAVCHRCAHAGRLRAGAQRGARLHHAGGRQRASRPSTAAERARHQRALLLAHHRHARASPLAAAKLVLAHHHARRPPAGVATAPAITLAEAPSRCVRARSPVRPSAGPDSRSRAHILITPRPAHPDGRSSSSLAISPLPAYCTLLRHTRRQLLPCPSVPSWRRPQWRRARCSHLRTR